MKIFVFDNIIRVKIKIGFENKIFFKRKKVFFKNLDFYKVSIEDHESNSHQFIKI